MIKYQGSCHCKAVKFEFQSESITEALQCNCSICTRKNAVMSKHYIEPEDFSLLSGKSDLSVYSWGDKEVNHYFCKQCGVYPFHDATFQPGKYRVNLGCVDSLNLASLKITLFDGKNLL